MAKKKFNYKVELFNILHTASRIADNTDTGYFLATTWARYFAKYVPMQTGTLRDSVQIEPFKVTYTQPYAHYQWNGMLYISPTTGTGWALPGEIKVPTDTPLNYSTEQNPLATSHWEVPAYEAFSETVAKQVEAYIRRKR